jgi:hypothetical protein
MRALQLIRDSKILRKLFALQNHGRVESGALVQVWYFSALSKKF